MSINFIEEYNFFNNKKEIILKMIDKVFKSDTIECCKIKLFGRDMIIRLKTHKDDGSRELKLLDLNRKIKYCFIIKGNPYYEFFREDYNKIYGKENLYIYDRILIRKIINKSPVLKEENPNIYFKRRSFYNSEILLNGNISESGEILDEDCVVYLKELGSFKSIKTDKEVLDFFNGRIVS